MLMHFFYLQCPAEAPGCQGGHLRRLQEGLLRDKIWGVEVVLQALLFCRNRVNN